MSGDYGDTKKHFVNRNQSYLHIVSIMLIMRCINRNDYD